ncbi:uncharacterized protein CLUP02_01583 [Colletotrichum lupini]|uniref:Secreted protein n=1 Tax=Colletotrichum lupini TaxID=145971 RepID=A0A9Q8WA25_9PEZI|nr:uncharacterized protein CLUP02_01583 [Colletotrichum lupini]KAK1706562.1 hypothetical protein BDP67DRAFT_529222 [Colletotrichum lupini]UQC74930.1 hypothetical protein CLUP02_01583 [Colletotrichum lupini]
MVPRKCEATKKRRSTVQPSITIVALLPFSISLTLASHPPSESLGECTTRRWDGVLPHDVSALLLGGMGVIKERRGIFDFD